jgi:hypothetical protein
VDVDKFDSTENVQYSDVQRTARSMLFPASLIEA